MEQWAVIQVETVKGFAMLFSYYISLESFVF